MTATAGAAATLVTLLLRRYGSFPCRVLPVPCVAVVSRCHTASALSAVGHPARPGTALKVEEPRPPSRSLHKQWMDHPDYRRWKDKEAEILKDVEPTISLAKDILHSSRYRDGECLSDKDEKAVVEKILAYHPHSKDKIGCGLDSIMVDRHPEFRNSRCLFVVRTDGGWIDFSYQKCLRAYIRNKYPLDAERFIKEHFKRT